MSRSLDWIRPSMRLSRAMPRSKSWPKASIENVLEVLRSSDGKRQKCRGNNSVLLEPAGLSEFDLGLFGERESACFLHGKLFQQMAESGFLGFQVLSVYGR